jgi:glycosyltransferase involved in cell wall biosynthesis
MKNKLHLIENGINHDEFNREKIVIPNSFKLPGKNKIKILFLGRFALSKNYYSIINSNIPDNIDIIIAGKNMCDDNIDIFNLLNIKDTSLQAKNIYIIDCLRNPERLWYMKSVDAIIMPSIHEPFGLVALEALSIQTLLCSLQNGLSYFLDETVCINCGIFPNDIEKAIHKFINLDDNTKNNIIKKGYERSLKYNWHNTSKKLLDIYTNIIN